MTDEAMLRYLQRFERKIDRLFDERSEFDLLAELAVVVEGEWFTAKEVWDLAQTEAAAAATTGMWRGSKIWRSGCQWSRPPASAIPPRAILAAKRNGPKCRIRRQGMAKTVEKVHPRFAAELRGFADALIAAGLSVDQVNVALPAALSILNENWRLWQRQERHKRLLRAMLQETETTENG